MNEWEGKWMDGWVDDQAGGSTHGRWIDGWMSWLEEGGMDISVG